MFLYQLHNTFYGYKMKINHVLVQTTDLKAMSTFLKQVTGLEEGSRPPFPFPGVWIYGDRKPLFHVVEIAANNAQQDYLGSAVEVGGAGAFDHVALEGADYVSLIERLKVSNIAYSERAVPFTKEHQVFIVGPDNVKVEMIFNQDKGDLASNTY